MVDRSCATRTLKVARHLQRTRPDLLPTVEPLEGFATLLEGTDPSMKFVLRDVFGPGGLPQARFAGDAPGWSGTIALVPLSILAGPRTFSVPPGDLDVLQRYLERVLPPLHRYLAPYGAGDVGLDPRRAELLLPAPRGLYNDSLLRAALDAHVRANALPAASTALVVLAPPGPLNTDADPGRGSLGYHAFGSVPYAFVPVGRGPFDLDDRGDAFALGLSHAVAEMVADPKAEIARPEVCDPCGPASRAPVRLYFDAQDRYVLGTEAFPPAGPYLYFLHAVAGPMSLGDSPASTAACAYPPPGPPADPATPRRE